MPRENQMPPDLRALIRAHVEAENGHRMSDTLATLHEDCVFEDVALGEVFRGRAGVKAYYQLWWDAFDLRFRREESDQAYWIEHGVSISEGRFYGKHVGPFLGIPPSGKSVEFRFTVFVTFRDGLMAGERFYYDLAGLLRQIGAIDLPLKLPA